MSDISLRQDVMDELEFEPSLDATHIGVIVENGIVTLTGHVKTYMEKLKAEEVVRRVKGVYGIAEELEVRYPSDKKTADDEIARRALDIINWGTTIPPGKIQVSVQAGWVTLSGEVDWYYQKTSAEDAVHRLSGVTGITNLLTIKPQPQVSDVKVRIENALKRNAELESGQIHVSVAGNKVILNGSVKSWPERLAAENAAWAAPGVTMVEDRLHIL
jgi:osmotically-inducible protein OsmY